MKFEKLSKGNKKIFLYGIMGGVVLLVSICFVGSHAKYKKIEDIELVKGNINYKPYDFKMMAMYKSDDGSNYSEITDMPSSGYVINEERSYCTTDNVNKVYGKVRTINGIHSLSSMKKNDKCYVYFDKMATSEDTLAKLNITSYNTKAPDFSTIATTDEGIFKTEDGMYGGYSYYWRGAATTNYVSFANKCWRIIRINGDGTIRLIYAGATCHANGESTTDNIVSSPSYNPSKDKSEYVGWKYTEGKQRPTSITEGTNSPIKTTLESWYTTNLASYESKIADGKYCNDRNVQSGKTWASTGSSFNYAALERLQNGTPTLRCDVLDTYTLKVGLITADEVVYAGGKDTANKSYYLYNSQNYWTMSPYDWSGPNSWTGVFLVDSNGRLDAYDVTSKIPGVRPVISLRANTTISSGDGTKDNPYKIS